MPRNISGSGIIPADCMMTLEAAKRETGFGTAALRQARREGLIVRRVGRTSFILGRDLIAYVEAKGKIVGRPPTAPPSPEGPEVANG